MLGFHKRSEGQKYIEEKYGVCPQPVEQPTNYLFSIYDVAEQRFKPPFVATTDTAARRAISEAMNADKQSLIYKYANEYNLFRLGAYDDKLGLIGSYSEPLKVCSLFDLKEKENTADLPSFVEKAN